MSDGPQAPYVRLKKSIKGCTGREGKTVGLLPLELFSLALKTPHPPGDRGPQVKPSPEFLGRRSIKVRVEINSAVLTSCSFFSQMREVRTEGIID